MAGGLGVRPHDYQIFGDERVSVEVRRLTVLARIVAPADGSRAPLERVEVTRAGTHEDRIPHDRGADEDSASRVVLPQDLARTRLRLSDAARQRHQNRERQASKSHGPSSTAIER